MQEDKSVEVIRDELAFEDGYFPLHHEDEIKNLENSIIKLKAKLEELNKRKADVSDQKQQMLVRIEEEGSISMVQKLLPLLETLKDLERKQSDFHSLCNEEQTKLEAEVNELGSIISGNDSNDLCTAFDLSLQDSIKRLDSAKKELASKLREVVLLKRQVDEFPSQAELVQYERRFSELNFHIQGKHRQTRKYFTTFNALLEIKELMLKEISLLNSISSQFQNAVSSASGRMKLIDSMEGILKGIQQKLEKVQVDLEGEQKVCDALKEKYAAAISKQREGSSLLKAFQEECAKNEMLRSKRSKSQA